MLAITALAAFLGHLYPIFFHFRGGKGVATAFGVLVAIAWQVGLATLVTWLFIAFLFHYSSLAALTAALATPVYMYWFTGLWDYLILSLILCSLLIWRHRSNIHHLLTGQEDKIGTNP
jgi:glycerol-3-phosphate acyltransferase PlsY